MCGIVGYVGKQQAYPILIKGLHRLEYRGYDSAGLALVNREGVLNVFKSKGKVADLEHFVESKDLDGTIGIAHTRWATHGEPNDINAHPHYSDSGNIALIHNGIIENYRVLKEALIENGYTFKSDTDTEVLVNLIEYIRTSNNCTLLEAVQQALKQVIGAYAIAVVEKGNQDQIIAARRSSPMVIGIGDKEFFLASDAASIVEYTDKIVYVNDGEVVVMDRNHPLKIVTLDNQESKIDIKKLQLSISQLEKGGYPHFMLKEIFEQPKTIVDCIRGRINPETYDVILSGIMDNRERFLNARRIIFVACGTSWHASLIGEYLIEDFCRIPVEVEYASEFRYRNPVIYPDDIVIAVSQSGETADTLAAIELAKQNGIGLVALGNNNHWMRGGTYGWLAAEKGCIGICWSNTAPNMPAWGAKDCRIGNNPLILAVPRSDGQHVMVDCALSQFSYGKLESTRLAGRQLPVPGGCDEDGQLTTDPAAIEKSGRALPIGYWKGSGLSILLDLISTLLSGGNAVHTIGTFGDEIGLTQIMIAIDPTKFGTVEENDAVIDAILADIKASTPARPDGEVRWPGEGMLRTIKENRELGVPVVEEIWESVLKM